MKSLMEEASSISKAIDSAWHRAGKPVQFSVKILEEPERNIFGLTKKSAKIALFFDEKQIKDHSRSPQRSYEQPRQREEQRPKRSENQQPKKHRMEWSEDLAQEASKWVNDTLSHIGLPHVNYSLSHSGRILKFAFDNSLTGTETKDRMLFSSFACLIMTTLRHKHKKQLRNLKVVLTTS